ncbi:hypothetical protein N9937_00325 [bacterium]|nr:hypothetical protein [bacterium]
MLIIMEKITAVAVVEGMMIEPALEGLYSYTQLRELLEQEQAKSKYLTKRLEEFEEFFGEIIEPSRDCGCSPCYGRCWSAESDLEYIRGRAEELLND